MNSVYLLIGGNLGDRIKNLAIARYNIEKEIGRIITSSSIYETASWGITEQPDFLNQVLLIEAKCSAEQAMQLILSIENKMGRVRTQKNASRVIDIDILFFNDEIINKPGLTIPHPEIQNRKFALIPMNEIAPDHMHPVIKKNIKNLLSTSADRLEVKVLDKS
ncbi:MAG TPA: 2-amino-4-hydroxy-6-hydroxymethyldihydropteridine diphosphokinase [Chitinophagaceae bacterium]|nr:2-amino-4-hydroxy-6-hydroxymethyldihydropteridine diphosphokinase [Chitinophagaceae bacterium]